MRRRVLACRDSRALIDVASAEQAERADRTIKGDDVTEGRYGALGKCHDACVAPDPSPAVLTDLAEIVHVTYQEKPSWLVAVRFRFDQGCLQVEVDPDDDTVEVSFNSQHRPRLRHWASDSVSRQMNQPYVGLIGQNSCWRWVLRNQQQYEDGFQIELGASASATTTLQYLALASRLHVRQVWDAPTP